MTDHFNEAFFQDLKRRSEQKWATQRLVSNIYGYQIQAGTRWRPGLSDAEIDTFENAMGFRFPPIYRTFLRNMNGTDKPTVNIYGSSGHPHTYSPGYYSFPDDLAIMHDRINWIYEAFGVDTHVVSERGIPHIMPIVEHRFLVIDRCIGNPVLSMYDTDVIVYAVDLPRFLLNDVRDGKQQAPMPFIDVPFWLDQE